MAANGPFTFPRQMTRAQAQELLALAYAEVNDGKVLRRALKLQRKAGLDPPGDVQYVSEPALEQGSDGLAVVVRSDILLYESFEGVDECVDLFEQALLEELRKRLERRVRAWTKSNPTRHQGSLQ